MRSVRLLSMALLGSLWGTSGVIFLGPMPSAHADQATFYKPIPWTLPSTDNHPAALPPPATTPPSSNLAGLFSIPQSVVCGRTLFDPDSPEVSTSDCVAVPGYPLDGVGANSATCPFEFMVQGMDFVTNALGGGNPQAQACIHDFCIDHCGPAPALIQPPAGQSCEDFCNNPNPQQVPQNIPQAEIIPLIQCVVQSIPIPDGCKTVGTSVFTTDMNQDLGDLLFEDLWTVELETQLVAQVIPDPTDLVAPTTSPQGRLLLPIDAVVDNFDSDPLQEVAVLNHFPLDPDWWTDYAALAQSGDEDDIIAYTLGLLPTPFPSFLIMPEHQDHGPIFTVMDGFESGPTFTDNTQNECTTNDAGNPPVSVKNCRSAPMAIESGPFTAAGAKDLVILHQYFFPAMNVPNPKPGEATILNMMRQFLHTILPRSVARGTAKDYCTNQTGGRLPGKVAGNTSSQPIDTNFLGLGFYLPSGDLLTKFQIHTPRQSQVLGYLTGHKNVGNLSFEKVGRNGEGGAAGGADPARVCVGKSPTDVAGGDIDRDGLPDLVVSNFGGFSLCGFWEPTCFGQMFSLELAGGMTFCRNYDGKGCQLLHIPIAPDLNSSHIQHYVDTAVGDTNGDGYDDAITFGLDGIGMHLSINNESLYTVPDVIRGPGVNAPDFGGKCNGQVFPAGCPNAQGEAVYSDLQRFADRAWRCNKLDFVDTDGDGDNEIVNPANPEEIWPEAGGKDPNLYTCEGTSEDVTAVSFQRSNAVKFVYEATYLMGLRNEEAWARVRDTGQFPPTDWHCGAIAADADRDVSTFTCEVPDFESYRCDYADADGDSIPDATEGGVGGKFALRCRGTTASAQTTNFPDALEIDTVWRDDAGHPMGMMVSADPFVERFAVYLGGYNFNINRNSEFAVYMNPGVTSPGNFTNRYPYLHYVDMAEVRVPRIVSDFPVKLRSLGAPLVYNKEMSVTHNLAVEGTGPGGTMGLGVWPIQGELADLVDKTGAPFPDGLDDAVVALNNSLHCAVIASQGGWEPFKSAPTIFFECASPKFAHEMAAFIQSAVDKLTTGQPLTDEERLRLLIAMMSGTSSLTVPADPINALNEFSEPQTRRGVVSIHGFPWRLLLTWLNSLELPFGSLLGNMLGP